MRELFNMNRSITNKMNVLIVDDEPNIRKTLSYCLKKEEHFVIAVSNVKDAIDESKRRSFDMAFIDLKLGEDNGIDLIPDLLLHSPWIKTVIITAHASIETAVRAIRQGAFDYIEKPFNADQIKIITDHISKIRKLETQIENMKEGIATLDSEACLNSQNPSVQKILETAKKAATSDAVILLRGESGTGKSLLARFIHKISPRSHKPIATVSCPSLPSELLESELFGHVKGAFTGAVKNNLGRIASCEGGSIFLDEIGSIPPSIQVKLLRFIQDKEFERLGDPTPRRADVRIIAATNVDLEKNIIEGKFREDLFYRLNVISLVLPSLRERPEDIIPLASSFLEFFCSCNHKKIIGFSDEVISSLQRYSWPGNIRELRNVIERTVILGTGEKVNIRDLPENISPSFK